MRFAVTVLLVPQPVVHASIRTCPVPALAAGHHVLLAAIERYRRASLHRTVGTAVT